MRKSIVSIIVMVLLFGFVPTIPLNANTDFKGNEQYYLNFCSQILTSDADVQTCVNFKKYYAEYSNSLQNDLNNMKGELETLKQDIDKLMSAINAQSDQIKTLDSQIQAVASSIQTMEDNLGVLEIEIEIKEADISIRDEQIKERMISMQKFMGINGYVDFVMGAKDLVDMVRRVSGVEKITGYDKEQIALLQGDIEDLNADKAELERQKQELDDRKVTLDSQRSILDQLKIQNEEYLNAFRSQEADYLSRMRSVTTSISDIAANMPNINTSKPGDVPNVGTNNGFVFPVQGSFYKSAGTWNYPASFGGGLHQGVDYAGAVGTTLVAPANSLVLYANNPCPTYSSGLGNNCGYPYGGGNTVLLVMEVNGTTYAVHYNHMARENFVVKGLSSVVAGQVIGGIGSSGNSTGPHLHIEVINLGSIGVYEAANQFSRTADFSFGTGWSAGNRCESNGWRAPCKERPESIFGV